MLDRRRSPIPMLTRIPFRSDVSALPLRELAVASVAFAAFWIVYFAPVLFSGRVLAVGDGVIYYLPALVTHGWFWSRDLYAGFPAFADPQAMVLSPLRMLGGHYNAAVVLIYVWAALGAYGLGRHLSGLRGGGALAALVYACGGPMLAHLGHLTIIYSAAWAPWMLWAVAAARGSSPVVAVCGGAAAIALALLGGHPQIFVYAVGVAAAYALFAVATAPSSMRAAWTARYAVMFATGAALASVQLLPLAELGRQSLRTQFSFAEFTTYSLSPAELLLLVFPNLWGGGRSPYFGVWGLTELATCCGMTAAMLAIAAFSARRRVPDVAFFGIVALAALAFALGPYTPLAHVVFALPGIGQFRAPGRAAFTTTLALAILATFGYQALVEGRLRGVRARRMWWRMLALACLTLGALHVAYPGLAEQAQRHGVNLASPWHNPAVLFPLATMAATALIMWSMRRGAGRLALPALALVIVVDLGAFGWYYGWPSGPETVGVIDPAWGDFAATVRASRTRVLFARGDANDKSPAVPNLSLLYDLPVAGAYGPLILANYAEVMDLDTRGATRSLHRFEERRKLGGIGWVVGRMSTQWPLWLGGDCSGLPGNQSASVTLPTPVRATSLEVTSSLGCSPAVPQGTHVLRVGIEDGRGGRATHELVAGVDTAEWAIDRPDVASVVRHRRPPRFESFPAQGFDGHRYTTTIPLADGSTATVSRLTFDWLLPAGPALALASLTLVDAASGVRRPIAPDALVSDPIPPGPDTLEHPLPGAPLVRGTRGVGAIAWAVGEALAMSADDAMRVVRSGRLPEGRGFDPYRTALVTDSAAAVSSGSSTPATVSVRQWDPGSLTIDVDAAREAFLVVAESSYPGWRARLDGVDVPIVSTNVAFQGLRVPAGRHVVQMSFVPVSLLRGLAIAAIGLAVLAAYIVISRRRARAIAAVSRA